MKREFLTGELGLSKEMTDKIMAEYGASVNNLRQQMTKAQEENIRLSELLSSGREETAQREELIERITALSEENSALLLKQEELKTAVSDIKRNSAISLALSRAGAKNLKAAEALLDKSAISETEEGMQGLSEQIEKMKQDCAYLFYDGFSGSGMRHTPAAETQDGFTRFARAGAKLN